MSRVRMSRSQRRAAAHLSGLTIDEYTGLWCCWVCARPMHPVLQANGFASHPDCDPGEVSERFPPETEPAWLRMQQDLTGDDMFHSDSNGNSFSADQGMSVSARKSLEPWYIRVLMSPWQDRGNL